MSALPPRIPDAFFRRMNSPDSVLQRLIAAS